ncbi:ABC transporter ATP-binding protein [Actinopolymorpha sp. NPDC004070]|uniref:ABC transporter ATP-binding protein n=1 Tax=Actinopolymorpha sp. NPDC004070 TaxID=3154548 RepID=UPI0033A37DE4
MRATQRWIARRLHAWSALLGLLWRADRTAASVLAGLAAAVGLLPLVVILATGALIDAVPDAVAHGLGSADGRNAALLTFVVVGTFAASSVAGKASAYFQRALESSFGLTVHETVARSVLSGPGLASVEDPRVADDLARLEEADKRGLFHAAVSSLFVVVSSRVTGLAAFVVLLRFRWWAPFVLAAAWWLTGWSYTKVSTNGVTVGRSAGGERLRRAEYLRGLAVDAPAAKEVRIFGLAEWVVGHYARTQSAVLAEIWHSRRGNRWLTAAVVASIVASHAVVLGVLGWSASNGEASASAVVVFSQAALATSSLGMLGDVPWWLARSLEVAALVEGVRARLEHTSGVHQKKGPSEYAEEESARSGAMSIDLRSVRFTYPGRDRPVLDELNLQVNAGQSLAIVGSNGAGKSTLIKLLCGMYEPDAGRIVLDRSLDPVSARGRVGVIFQDFVKYELTLRDNVAFGSRRPRGGDRELERCLNAAGGGQLLADLPRGWDTVLAGGYEGGVNLSGGQWQRVALARALVSVRAGAGLLILDEPTANLDVRAETELFDRFLELTAGVTTILVSHRLSSVRHADRIVVLHDGRVAEAGTHEDLVATGGRYARMYALQAQRFTSEVHGGA